MAKINFPNNRDQLNPPLPTGALQDGDKTNITADGVTITYVFKKPASPNTDSWWKSMGRVNNATPLDKIEEGNSSVEVIDTGSNGQVVVTTEGDARMKVTSDGTVKLNGTNIDTDPSIQLNPNGSAVFKGDVTVGGPLSSSDSSYIYPGVLSVRGDSLLDSNSAFVVYRNGSTPSDITSKITQSGSAEFAGTMQVGDYAIGGPSNAGTYITENGTIYLNKNTDGPLLKGRKNESDTTVINANGSAEFAKDIEVNGITVGRGSGDISTNTVFGQNALASATGGGGNTAIGRNTLSNILTGTSNTALGNIALQNTTGNDNTALGTGALQSNVGGSSAVAIGFYSQQYANDQSSVFTNTNTSVGYQSLRGSSTPGDNTGTSNTAIGYQSMSGITSGFANTAVGRSSLVANTKGTDNCAFGYNTLPANISGNQNIAIGGEALRTNNIGSYNIAIGHQSLYTNLDGIQNVGIGWRALNSNSSGSFNTGVGYSALLNATGGRNTALGRQAGDKIVAGTENVLLGYNAGHGLEGSESGNVIIGSQILGEVGISNTIIMGTAGTERLRINDQGRVILPGSSVEGIQFGSTDSSGNIISKTLDDYEEGTFTPTFTSGISGTITYDQTGGSYTKVGSLVTFNIRIHAQSGGTDTSAHLIIGGLPFTSSTTKRQGGAWFNYVENLYGSGDAPPILHIPQNGTTVRFQTAGGTSWLGTSGNGAAGKVILISGQYYV